VEHAKSRALYAAIGERLCQLRQQRGVRQEDVAAGARKIGLRWNRATVALIENGLRKLSLGEFLALPYIFIVNDEVIRGSSWQPQKRPDLADFLPSKGWLEVARGCTLPAPLLRDVVTANVESILIPTSISAPCEAGEGFLESEALGDAEEKAGRRLKVSAVEVAKAARGLWGHSLTAERDRRVAENVEKSSPRTLQALRGHVSRTLTAEIADVIAKTDRERLRR